MATTALALLLRFSAFKHGCGNSYQYMYVSIVRSDKVEGLIFLVTMARYVK